jgi:predicted PurR-regulated permease PerM
MLLSLAFWAAIWGVVGMFLAVPLMVVIMIVCSHFQATRPIAIIMSARGELPTEDARLEDGDVVKRVA